ncbi:MAG: tRNA (adenosine(37)-N6)-threonylcarbamoyltransferase complex transferase subunit TsaD, partial [Candidatus Ryanbacteria bacterium]|nr:tRNA (adenosine(37)-N6)-threonylcarbamoyltransferase complex transferase subunit TsaD [Candidatus Ryanbacteria bacterium]
YSKNDIAASFQDAVVDVLLTKTFRAYREYSAKSVIIGGGVAANKLLRQRFIQSFGRKNLLLAPTKFTGDNAAMIAASAYFHALKKDFTGWKNLTADATLSL